MLQKQCYETKYFWTLQGNGLNSKKSNEELKSVFLSLRFGNSQRRPEDFRCTWEGWHIWPLPKTFLDLHNSSYDSQLYSITVNYVLVKSKLQHRPRAFDFCCPRGWGIWTTALISCDMSRCFKRGWWTLEWFQRERLWLHGQVAAKQRSTQALCHVRRYLNSFLWFMLWIYEYVLSHVAIKYSTGDLLPATCNVY